MSLAVILHLTALFLSRYILDENSPLARPVKRSNAKPSEASARAMGKVRYDNLDEEISEAFASTTFNPAKDNVRDANLTLPQMALRYQGMECSVSRFTRRALKYEDFLYLILQ